MTQIAPSYFDEKKASEVAFFFLSKAKRTNGHVTKVRLVKWFYLAERLSYARYGEPLTGDQLFSMEHGPVLGASLTLMESADPSKCGNGTWSRVVVTTKKPGEKHQYMELADDVPYKSNADLLTLSKADLELLEDVWAEHSKKSTHELERMLHDRKQCPEWRWRRGDGRNPIEVETLLSALKFDEQEKSATIEWLTKRDEIERAFAH